ncbi:MAG: DUF2612 domain-containing protein [Candidatus Paceibacterota bacterium]|jgi:hypothetical protein
MSQIQALDFSVDLMRALLWQYNDAARLEALVRQKQEWYDANQSAFWSDWVADVFDLRTANDFGLSVWAIILDIPLAITTAQSPTQPGKWAFGEFRKNFTHGNFAASTSSSLTTEQKRLILRLRYFQLITSGAVPEINTFFADLFGEFGPAYVLDGYDMTAFYVFNFALSSKVRTVLTEFDLLPRPAGVKVSHVVIGQANGWGFEQYRKNFNNGNFNHA